MPKFQHFKQLEDPAFFHAFVTETYQASWEPLTKAADCELVIDQSLVRLAHTTYMANLGQYTERLHSANPDHFKRAGSLLHALYKTGPVTDVKWSRQVDDLRTNLTLGTTHAEAEEWDKFYKFFDDYWNEAMAFDLAYRCCQVFVRTKKEYDYDFLHNVCYYMKENTDISVGSFIMMLKAFWA